MRRSSVPTSDNKYVQFRYMSSSTAVADFTNVANWQGVDETPTAESKNLVKSGGVAEKLFVSLPIDWVADECYYSIANEKVNIYSTGGTDYKVGTISVSELIDKTIIINCASKSETNQYTICHAFADDEDNLIGEAINIKPSQVPQVVTVPDGATKLCVTCYKPVSGNNAAVYLFSSLNELNTELRNVINAEKNRAEGAEGNLLTVINSIDKRTDLYNIIFPEWYHNCYVVISNGVASINNSANTGSGTWVGIIEVSNFIGKKIQIKCINNGSNTTNSHVFVDAENNIIGEPIIQTSSNNPVIATIPTGATKLYVVNRLSENNNNTFFGIEGNIIACLNTLEQAARPVKKELSIDYLLDNTYGTEDSNGKFTTGTSSDFKVGEVDVRDYIGCQLRIDCVTKPQNNTYNIGHAFVDSAANVIDYIINVKPSQNPVITNVPVGAVKLYITCYKTESGDSSSVIVLNQSLNQAYDNLEARVVKINQWYGKKILWLGTSIPWGQSSEDEPGTHRVEHPYPQQVCAALGATLIDSTHGGLAQMATYNQENSMWVPMDYGSTCLTRQECIDAWNAGLARDLFSQYSYENTLLGKDADLYVFDVEPNNVADGSADDLALFDWRLWKYTDDSSFASHRNTYIGALIYEIDQLLTEKPNAVIVFIGEYLKMKLNNYTQPNDVRTQSLALCEKFHIHYIDLAEKLFYNGKNADVWVNDDMIHPKRSTYDRMAKMLINELLLIA